MASKPLALRYRRRLKPRKPKRLGLGERMMVLERVCPDRRHHTPRPHGYVAHGEWMDRMAKTHQQRQCPTCGLWTWWVREFAGPAPKAGRR